MMKVGQLASEKYSLVNGLLELAISQKYAKSRKSKHDPLTTCWPPDQDEVQCQLNSVQFNFLLLYSN
jgi:hypothetical protein